MRIRVFTMRPRRRGQVATCSKLEGLAGSGVKGEPVAFGRLGRSAISEKAHSPAHCLIPAP